MQSIPSKAAMLPILTYHSIDNSNSVISISTATFQRHIECLAQMKVRGISLREAVEHRAHFGCWPDSSAVLTFDDGFGNFYEVAWPVLATHGFTATVFLVSGHVGRNNDWSMPPAGLGRLRMLSWCEVVELSRYGIEFGAHSQTHRDLRRLSRTQVLEEIAGSKAEITQRVGRQIESFAYPYGYHNDTTREAVRQEYRSACTTSLRRADTEPLHLLPRVDSYYISSPLRLKMLIAGRLDSYLAIRKWGRSLRDSLHRDAEGGRY